MTQLTQGAVDAMHKGQQIRSPLVQVIDVKKILGPNGQATAPERYRLVISDGVHFQQAMLATQLNELVNEHKLVPKCVIRLNEYICNTVHDRRIVIVLSVALVGPPLPHNIGNPQNIETGAAAPSAVSTAAPVTSAPAQRAYQPNVPASRAAGSTGRGPSPTLPEGVIPIKGLNPYQNRWTIKARVTAKSDKREFNGSKGPSQLFSVDLLDAYGGEIRCTFFGDAVEQWWDTVTVGNVYLIGRGNVKYANKRFSSLKNDYEISLDRGALVQPADDDASIPHDNFKFVDIRDLPTHEKEEFLDIIGVVLEVGNLADINTKAGNVLQKRVIKVGDASNAQVEVTLWGDQAAHWSHFTGVTIAFKGVKLSDFNGRSLSLLRSSKLEVEPNSAAADSVRRWFESVNPADVISVSTSEFRGRGEGGGYGGGEKRVWDETRKTLAQVKAEASAGQDTSYFNVRATVTEIKHDKERPPWYEACPKEGCNKKVTAVGGTFLCSKCSTTYEHYTPRYVLNINVNDHSGSSWLTCFNDTAPGILNDTTAETLVGWLANGDNAHYEEVFQKSLFKTYSLRVRAQQSEYDSETKIKLSVLKVMPMDYAKESSLLIASISKSLTA